MGINPTCWTAHCQGLGFNEITIQHSGIVIVAGCKGCAILDNLESKYIAIARLRDPTTGHEDRCIARHIDGLRRMLDTALFGFDYQVVDDQRHC